MRVKKSYDAMENLTDRCSWYFIKSWELLIKNKISGFSLIINQILKVLNDNYPHKHAMVDISINGPFLISFN